MKAQHQFNDTINNPLIDSEILPPKKRGRSKKLIDSRNVLLAARYWYYGRYTDLKYDFVIEKLSEEFYLAPHTIVNLISLNDSLLLKLRQQEPTIKELRELWPFFIWES